MLETLLKILVLDVSSPEIMLEEDGDICLDWFDPMLSVSIGQNGNISWASIEPSEHGNDFERLKIILESRR